MEASEEMTLHVTVRTEKLQNHSITIRVPMEKSVGREGDTRFAFIVRYDARVEEKENDKVIKQQYLTRDVKNPERGGVSEVTLSSSNLASSAL